MIYFSQSVEYKKYQQYNSFLKIVVHLVFLRYLEQNFEELGKKQQSLKSIFKTRKLKLVEKLESETD